MVTIIDCGMGNMGSVLNMVRKVGGTGKMAVEADEILRAEKLILPGVGSFGYGMEQLRKRDLTSVIAEKAAAGTPILGICLGMQLLAAGSEEADVTGLGLIDAHIKRFSFPADSPPIPHVGWRDVVVAKDNPLLSNGGEPQRFYFTHSYHAVCSRAEDVLATTTYGYEFTAAFARGNIYGVQFHPEKSHRFGMALIRNFLKL